MKEIKRFRKPNEKHFMKSDGTMVAYLYDDNIHYLKDNKYEVIDNTIIKEDNYFVNKANLFKAKFDISKENNSLFKIEKEKSYLDFSLKNSNKNIENIKSNKNKIFYNKIFKDVDLNYEMSSKKLKESIILNNIESINTELVFDIDTNLKLELTKHGTIEAKLDNDIVYIIEKPYMIDSNGDYGNANYSLEMKDDSYSLKLNMDKKWLNAKKRKFPVIIDPTIIVDTTTNIYDTYIYEGDTNIDRNNTDILKVGVSRKNNQDTIYRTLIKFDLPVIPTGCVVTNASLNLTSHSTDVFDSEIGEAKPITDIHKITSDWQESEANWSNMHDKYDECIEDCAYTFKSIVNAPDEIALRTSSFNITNMVKRWYSGEPNYGVMIKKHIEEYNEFSKADFYYSKNHTLTSVDPKPVLTISYRNQNGIENYYSYDEQSFEDGESFVNRSNGNLTTCFSLNSTVNGKFPADLRIYYNTNDFILKNNYGYGKGYKLNYYQILKEKLIDENNYIEYLDQDGTIHYFYQNGDVYEDEDGLGYTITIDENQKYTITDSNNSKMIFEKIDSIWYLKNIVNSNGDTITIEHDSNNRIIKVIDADNKEINLTYETNKIVISSDWTTSTLNYSNDKVISLETKNGTTLFSYNSNDLLEKITDISSKSIKFEYYDVIPYRISKVSEYGCDGTIGNYVAYKYGFDSTTIVDNKNRVNTYCFNANGSAISMSTLSCDDKISEGYGKTNSFYTYGGRRKNKPIDTTSLVRYSKNYLVDSSFENGILQFSNYANTTNILHEGHTGEKSLKIYSPSTGGQTYLDVDVTKGNFYTFSVYLKGMEDCTLELSYTNADGVQITSKTKTNYEEDFSRYDVSIEYKEDAISPLRISIFTPRLGELIIDDVQLEKGLVSNYYNLVENSDFENGLEGWNITATSRIEENYTIPSDEVITLSTGEKALMLKSDPYVDKTLEKVINISGSANDTFNLSFWYKNLGIETSYQSSIYGNFIFALINFNYTSEVPATEPYMIKLQLNSKEWQFFSGNYTAMGDYDKITITLMDLRNANNLYLTCFSLFKDLGNTTYYYDDNGNLTYVVNKSNNTVSFNYDKDNQLVNSFDPVGNITNFEYDNNTNNKLLSGITQTGISNIVVYDNNQNPIKTIIKNTNVDLEQTSNYCYIRGKGTNKYFDIDLTNLKINLKSNECSHDNWIIEKEEENYRIKHGILQKYITGVSDDVILTNNIDNSSLWTLEKCQNGSYGFKLYDTNKYLSVLNDEVIIKKLSETSYIDDDYSIQFYIENINNSYILNEAIYSESGKVITKKIDSLLNETSYDINENNNLLNSSTNALGKVTNYEYNNKEQLIKVIDSDIKVEYNYNNQNLLSKIITEDKEYSFEYDSFLNNKSVKIKDNTLITNNYEPNNGNLLSSAYGNGNVISYEHDDFDRLKKVTKMDDIYQYYYNNIGRLSKVTSNNDSYKFYYDFANRLNKYNYNEFTINLKYNNNNNISEKKYELTNVLLSTLNYNYDEENSISNMSFNDETINYIYDDIGRIIEINLSDNYKIKYNYISKGKRTSNLISSIQINNNLYTYKYDKVYNITHIYLNGTLKNKYEYDEFYQLIKEDNYILNRTFRYNYDLSGNILSKKEYELESYNLLNDNKYEYSNGNWKDQLTKYNNDIITYDAIGNPLTIGNNITLNWINGRTLNSYIDTNKNLNVSYKYDKDGLRLEKNVDNTIHKYYKEGKQIIIEEIGDDVLYYIRDISGKLVALKHNNNLYYYELNLQNDVIGLLDSNYNKIAAYEYDSWGSIISIKDANGNIITDETNIAIINPYRYRSYYYDEETKLYYLNTRYYNPLWGRFINADNILIQSAKTTLGNNLYMYVYNNPINFQDSTGHKPIWNWINNNIIKPIERTLIKTVSTIAGFIGLPTASTLLNHSLQDKPKNLKYTDTSKIAKDIKSSQEFKTAIKEIATENPNKTFDDFHKIIRFDSIDLNLGLQHASMYVNGGLDKGIGTLSITIQDTYDFDYVSYKESPISRWPINFINNIAWVDQELGYINNYDIIIEFEVYINEPIM